MNNFAQPASVEINLTQFSVRLDGARIQLVRSGPAFARQVWDYIQRDHAMGGTLYSWVESLDDVVKHVATEPAPNTNEIDYLILREGKAIGSIHVHTISFENRQAEIGYGIESAQQGRGYVSEAVHLLLAELKRVGFKNVAISCDKTNTGSIRVAERNGFQRELIGSNCPNQAIVFAKFLC